VCLNCRVFECIWIYLNEFACVHIISVSACVFLSVGPVSVNLCVRSCVCWYLIMELICVNFECV
jgi:hypothetical protein